MKFLYHIIFYNRGYFKWVKEDAEEVEVEEGEDLQVEAEAEEGDEVVEEREFKSNPSHQIKNK